MESKNTERIVKILKSKKNHQRIAAVLIILSLVVGLSTTYVLRSKGTAMTHQRKTLACQLEIHEHTDDCFDENDEVICGYADYVVHTHNDDCYDSKGNLVCIIDEVENHIHDDSCYSETKTLICEESSDCHDHDESCYQIEKKLVCGKLELHTHTNKCFQDGKLICGQMELVEHVHTADCFITEEIPAEEISTEEETSSEEESSEENSEESFEESTEESSEESSEASKTEEEAYAYEIDYEDSEIRIEVAYNDDAELPEDTEVVATKLDSEEGHCRYDISLQAGGQEVEPNAQVKVKVAFLDGQFGKNDTLGIDHYANDNEEAEKIETLTEKNTKKGKVITFYMDSFSEVDFYSLGDDGTSTLAEDVDESTATPAHRKYIKDNGNFTYDLTLDVTGSVGTKYNKDLLDIIVVFDISGSMNDEVATTGSGWNQKSITRLDRAKDAMKNFAQTISNKEATGNVSAQWKLITFSSSVNNPTSWLSTTDFSGRFGSSMTANGGTNYEAALKKAGSTLSAGTGFREGAQKIVIFVTDGVPTYHDTNSKGGGSTTEYEDYDGAIDGADDITCDRFYCIGIDIDNTNKQSWRHNNIRTTKTPLQILQDVTDNVTATVKPAAENVSSDNLSSKFAEIGTSFTTYDFSNVKITDKLSDSVAILDDEDNPQLSIKVTDAAGNVQTTPAGITATYDKTKREFYLNFPSNYKLVDGWTYSVTAKIKPSDKVNDYWKNTKEPVYPNKGDANTDAEGNTSSSNQQGFFSNDADATKVEYTYNGDHTSAKYPRPVVQVDTETFHFEVVPETKTTDEEHAKVIKYNYVGENPTDDYDLTLSFKGPTQSTTTTTEVIPKVDVVFVVDLSNSMKWPIDYTKSNQNDMYGDPAYKSKGTKEIDRKTYEASRFYYQNEALKAAVSALAENEQVDAHYSLVGFDQKAGVLNNWQNASVSPTLPNQVAKYGNGGTNYEAGLEQARILLNSSACRADAQKVIVFLTDGEPTYRGISTISGTGSSDRDGANLTAAGNKLKAISDSGKLDLLYCVGVASSDTVVNNLSTLLTTYIDTTKTNTDRDETYYFNGNSSKELEDAFSNITKSIIENTAMEYATNVTISDTLSEYAEIVPGSMATISVLDKEGNEVGTSTPGKIDEAGAKYTVTSGVVLSTVYDAKTKTVSLEFPDNYKLDSEYTYKVTFTVRATDKAYDQYTEDNGYFRDVIGPDGEVGKTPSNGDQNTDATGNNTSSGKPGFRSNAEAKVTYDYKGEKVETPYDHPVIQVCKSKVVLTKYQPDGETVLSGAVFQLKKDGAVVNDATGKAITYTTDENGQFTIDSSILVTGTYTLEETSAPYAFATVAPISFTVSRGQISGTTDVQDQVTWSAVTKTPADATAPVNCLFTNPISVSDPYGYVDIDMKKVDYANEETPLKGAEFSIYDKNPEVRAGETKPEPILTKVTSDEEGMLVFPDQFNGFLIGQEYYLEETKSPDGYNKMDKVVKFTASLSKDKVVSVAVTPANGPVIYKDGVVLIHNTTGYELPETGGVGTKVFTAIGMMLIMAAGLVLVLKHRKSAANH